MNATDPEEHEFTVVLRGPSAAIFRQGEGTGLYVPTFPSSIGPVSIGYATRYIKRAEDVVVPGHIWIEVRGRGRQLEECIPPFANAGLALLPIFAVSANAAIEEAEVEVAFDSTNGISERDYFQCYVAPEAETVLYTGRHIDAKATVALLDSIDRSTEADRLRRAANQYRLALNSWRMGHETLVNAHLWMALEALTPAKIRAECAQRNLRTPSELAASMGVELKQLDAEVRKDAPITRGQRLLRTGKGRERRLRTWFFGVRKDSRPFAQ